MFLNTKIPPPVVTILFAIMIFYFSDNFPSVDLPFKIYISIFFILLGFFVTFSSARNFKKKDTTVNPMKPNETSKLVTDGFFKITRNPMYLGMLLFLLGLSEMDCAHCQRSRSGSLALPARLRLLFFHCQGSSS